MVYLPSFAFLLVGVVAVAEANFSKPPVCKMTGDAYPPSMKPLPTGEPKNITTFVVVSKICVTSRRRTGAGLFNTVDTGARTRRPSQATYNVTLLYFLLL